MEYLIIYLLGIALWAFICGLADFRECVGLCIIWPLALVVGIGLVIVGGLYSLGDSFNDV